MPTSQKSAGGATAQSADTAKIATKNLELISELLMFESLANKKNKYYSSMVSDPTVSETVKKHVECHKSRYDALLKYLESHK